jgi:hypothetical protein
VVGEAGDSVRYVHMHQLLFSVNRRTGHGIPPRRELPL